MKPKKEVQRYFLACEIKPKSPLWSVFDPFVYDVKPAFIQGTLGVINYDPDTYAIIDVIRHGQPLLGYVMTITNNDTVLLLDKIKGWHGPNACNYHNKTLVKAYTDVKKKVTAWAYVITDQTLHYYRQIEQVQFGIHDPSDQEQLALLEKLDGHG